MRIPLSLGEKECSIIWDNNGIVKDPGKMDLKKEDRTRRGAIRENDLSTLPERCSR
jgi:hypothetical protein